MKNKLTSLIAGPTDRTKVIRFGSLSNLDYYEHLEAIAGVMSEYISDVNIIPD